jgi:acetate kinase
MDTGIRVALDMLKMVRWWRYGSVLRIRRYGYHGSSPNHVQAEEDNMSTAETQTGKRGWSKMGFQTALSTSSFGTSRETKLFLLLHGN